MPQPLRPLLVYFANTRGGAGATDVSISFPNLPVSEFRVVQWGDGSSDNVYGGVGNRIVHNYGNPQHAARPVSVYGDIDVVSFYDACGERAAARISFWGDYTVGSVILPDLTVVPHP